MTDQMTADLRTYPLTTCLWVIRLGVPDFTRFYNTNVELLAPRETVDREVIFEHIQDADAYPGSATFRAFVTAQRSRNATFVLQQCDFTVTSEWDVLNEHMAILRLRRYVDNMQKMHGPEARWPNELTVILYSQSSQHGIDALQSLANTLMCPRLRVFWHPDAGPAEPNGDVQGDDDVFGPFSGKETSSAQDEQERVRARGVSPRRAPDLRDERVSRQPDPTNHESIRYC